MRILRSVLLLLFLATALPAGALPAATGATSAPPVRDDLVAALARDLTSHFNLDGELHLELSRPWTLPTGVAARWTVDVIEYPAAASSAMIVRCRLRADQTPAGEATLVLRASLWREVWITRAPLAAGALFDPAQLESRRVDLFRERDAVPTTRGDHTQIFTRTVPANHLLSWRDLARRPLVKKGNVVEVAAVEGRLLITLKALALENGARGDTVTIRNPESQKNFAAVVTDENRVQVRF